MPEPNGPASGGVHASQLGDLAVVAVVGRLPADLASQLRRAAGEASAVVVDLGRLEAEDVDGPAVVEALRTLVAGERDVVVACSSLATLRRLSGAGMHGVVSVVEDVVGAQARLRRMAAGSLS